MWQDCFDREIVCELEYRFLSRNYPSAAFYTSSEVLQRNPTGLSFQYGWKSRILQSFKSLLEAGILFKAKNEDLDRKLLFNRTAVTEVGISQLENVATLRGAFPTVFIVAGSLIGVASLVFVGECRSFMWELIEIYRQLWRK